MKKIFLGSILAILASVTTAQNTPISKPSDLTKNPKIKIGAVVLNVEFESQNDEAFNCALAIATTQKVNVKYWVKTTVVGSNKPESSLSLSFSKPFPKLNKEVDDLVTALSNCRSVNSKFSWAI